MKRILSILLAFFILISNFGLALGTHFCGGRAVESRLVFHQQDLHCGMDVSQMQCDDHSKEGDVVKNVCCENDFLSLDVDENYNHHDVSFKIDPVFAVAFTVSFLEVYFEHLQRIPQFDSYKAPPILRSVQTFYQVFII